MGKFKVRNEGSFNGNQQDNSSDQQLGSNESFPKLSRVVVGRKSGIVVTEKGDISFAGNTFSGRKGEAAKSLSISETLGEEDTCCGFVSDEESGTEVNGEEKLGADVEASAQAKPAAPALAEPVAPAQVSSPPSCMNVDGVIKAGISVAVGCIASNAELVDGLVKELPAQQGKVPQQPVHKVFDKMPGSDSATIHKSPWLNLFADKRKSNQGMKLHACKITGESLILKQEELDDVVSVWGHVLVGYVAGKNPGRGAIIKYCKSWKVKHDLHFHGSGWLVIQFESEEDKTEVLEKGPHYIFNRPLLLKVLPEMFDFNQQEICKVPVWIRLPNLPFEMWNAQILSRIATYVGKPIQTDKPTEAHARVTFARILVEVDVSQDVPLSINIVGPSGNAYDQSVIYESMPRFCTTCKTLGHTKDSCHLGKVVKNRETQPVARPAVGVPSGVVDLPIESPLPLPVVVDAPLAKVGVVINGPEVLVPGHMETVAPLCNAQHQVSSSSPEIAVSHACCPEAGALDAVQAVPVGAGLEATQKGEVAFTVVNRRRGKGRARDSIVPVSGAVYRGKQQLGESSFRGKQQLGESPKVAVVKEKGEPIRNLKHFDKRLGIGPSRIT